ncbi:MAG: hypothetical protein RBR99_05705 [Dehalococcoidales bacterium]|jgi:hypothetical protein|nr:hypothetical protein [Dehalococcoidales bacterium]MDX9986930.1 hypothetical protein [Dehalococcoidales bacterium]NLE89472.1 hypothetical protein [Dehalococcoidales bacterium]
MNIQQVGLLVLMVIGGIAVLGSYVFGVKNQAGGTSLLWGGIPQAIRPVYTVSMLVAATGYFFVIYHVLFNLQPSAVKIFESLDYNVFFVVLALILIPSALWMPLTSVYVKSRSTTLKFSIRIVLAVVGIASIAMAWALITLQPQSEGVFRYLAIYGSIYFAFHTAVLDGVVWSVLMP